MSAASGAAASPPGPSADPPAASPPPAATTAVRAPGRGLRMTDLLVLSLAGPLAGQLGRLPLLGMGGKDAALLLTDALVVAAVATGGWILLRERRLELPPAALLTLVFAGVGALSALASVARFGLSPGETLFSLAYLARWVTIFGVYVVTVNLVRARDVEGIWRWVERAILVFAAFGIVQALFLPDFAFLVYPDARPYIDWDPQGHRLVSTLLDPNLAGFLIVTGLLVQIGRLAFGEPVARWKVILLAAGLVLTVSRSSLLAFIAGGLVILFVRRPGRRLAVTMGLLALLALATAPFWLPFAIEFNKLSLDDASGLSRLVQWGWAWTVLQDHPWAGVGFNTYGFVQARYGFTLSTPSSFGLDGGILFIAVMTGVIGVALFTGILALLLRGCARAWRAPGVPAGQRGLALGAGALVPAVVVHSLFVNTLLYGPLLHVLWLLWGLAWVVAWRQEPEEGAPAAG